MSSVLLAAEAGGVDFPILGAVVLTPVVGAIAVALVSRRRPEIAKQLAVLFSVATGALTIGVLALFETHEGGFQLTEQATWIREPHISWALGVDGISLWLVVLTGVLFPIALLGAPPHRARTVEPAGDDHVEDHSDDKTFYAWLLLLEAGCLGAFLALDLFLFFVFFEIVLVPMYFLISGWGYEHRRYAANKFFLYTMFGSAFMLVGTIATAYLHAKGGPVTFDLRALAEDQGALAVTTSRWLFLSFAVAFAVKVPLFPVHTWLPDAHTQAPTAGSVILAGVMLKLGTYGFLRFGLYLFPEAAVWAAPGMVTLGVIGIVYGAVCATMQRNLKRIIAYSSVAHLGFIALGTFSLTTQGLQGSVFQMVAHGFTTGALFLLCGLIYERRHTYELRELGGGLQNAAPKLAGVFTVVMLASVGLPGLNGFVGEFLILQGSFLTRRWWAVVAVVGVILAALYLLWAYQRVFHGERHADNATVRDLTFADSLVMAPLVAVIVVMGVYPKPMFDRIEPAVDRLVRHVEDNSDYREPDVAEEGEEIVPESERRQEGEHGGEGAEVGAGTSGAEGGGH
ncbi:MAG TPA: NADH-quinone oxidoreductase subunit M [Aquihabitans sp.]|jgi:NADH-quinone oxidoreductase subunit M|nr:NADH-quinone oxidoreductase subunit M [Aquihabitans sp.]